MRDYQQQQPSPLLRLILNPRVLVAVVMLLGAVVTYYSNTQVNPVTGEAQHVALTAEQEIALGLESAPRMAQEMGGVVDPRSPAAAFVTEVGERLYSRSEASKSPYNFRFHLLKDPETINAFALPGGQIFITQGLLRRLKTEAQVAGVLGHEIGHVIHRHAAQHMAKGQFGQTLTQAVGVAAGGSDSGRMAQAAAQMVNKMKQLQYGRGDESQSDSYGLKIMVEAGYDPRGMQGVMEVLAEAAKGPRQPEFLSTHPHPETRLEVIKEFLAEKYPNGVPAELSQGRKLNWKNP